MSSLVLQEKHEVYFYKTLRELRGSVVDHFYLELLFMAEIISALDGIRPDIFTSPSIAIAGSMYIPYRDIVLGLVITFIRMRTPNLLTASFTICTVFCVLESLAPNIAISNILISSNFIRRDRTL